MSCVNQWEGVRLGAITFVIMCFVDSGEMFGRESRVVEKTEIIEQC